MNQALGLGALPAHQKECKNAVMTPPLFAGEGARAQHGKGAHPRSSRSLHLTCSKSATTNPFTADATH